MEGRRPSRYVPVGRQIRPEDIISGRGRCGRPGCRRVFANLRNHFLRKHQTANRLRCIPPQGGLRVQDIVAGMGLCERRSCNREFPNLRLHYIQCHLLWRQAPGVQFAAEQDELGGDVNDVNNVMQEEGGDGENEEDMEESEGEEREEERVEQGREGREEDMNGIGNKDKDEDEKGRGGEEEGDVGDDDDDDDGDGDQDDAGERGIGDGEQDGVRRAEGAEALEDRAGNGGGGDAAGDAAGIRGLERARNGEGGHPSPELRTILNRADEYEFFVVNYQRRAHPLRQMNAANREREDHRGRILQPIAGNSEIQREGRTGAMHHRGERNPRPPRIIINNFQIAHPQSRLMQIMYRIPE